MTQYMIFKKIQNKKESGFTLIELLVVIAIIGILSSVVLTSLSSARDKAKMARRVADARQVKTALESYAIANNGAYPSSSNGWNSQCTTWGGLSNANVIPGLTPTYMPTLPQDPDSSGVTNCCYVYRSDGTDYKFIVGYNCGNVTYSAYPTLTDPARSNAWAVYTSGASGW